MRSVPPHTVIEWLDIQADERDGVLQLDRLTSLIRPAHSLARGSGPTLFSPAGRASQARVAVLRTL